MVVSLRKKSRPFQASSTTKPTLIGSAAAVATTCAHGARHKHEEHQ
jgi:hypothetical protein